MTRAKWTGHMAQVVVCLLSKALSSIPPKKKKKMPPVETSLGSSPRYVSFYTLSGAWHGGEHL
jgi:hypothetical protein